MSLFSKPKKEDKRLKMYVYGDTGTGKTVTGLHFPSPAVLDLDKGCDHYVGHFDFEWLKTSDIEEAGKAIDELIADPQKFKTLMIDGMSNYCDLLMEKHIKRLRLKSGKSDYAMQPKDYKPYKHELHVFVNKLLALDMNIIATAKTKPLYASGESEFMKIIGVQDDAHKDIRFMFDVVLELSIGPDNTRIAKVIKDRTNRLPKLNETFEFSWESLTKYLDMEVLNRPPVLLRQQQNLVEQAGKRNTKIKFNGEDKLTAGVTADTLGKLVAIMKKFTEQELNAKLYEDYFVNSMLDLKEDEARQFLLDLTNEAQSKTKST